MVKSRNPIPGGVPVTFLIDGYNLMHAVGLLGSGPATPGLEQARKRFLDWLATSIEGHVATLLVVFDAEKSRGPSRESNHKGIRIRFAYHRTADDEIEDLLAAESNPASITVVSNDTRLQDAGRHRGAAVNACEEFVDWLIETPGKPAGEPEVEKPGQGATPDEMAAWLAAFSQPPKRRKP